MTKGFSLPLSPKDKIKYQICSVYVKTLIAVFVFYRRIHFAFRLCDNHYVSPGGHIPASSDSGRFPSGDSGECSAHHS